MSVLLAVTLMTVLPGFSSCPVWASDTEEDSVLPDGMVGSGTVSTGTGSNASRSLANNLTTAYGKSTMSDAEIQALLDGSDNDILLTGVTVSTSLTVSQNKTVRLFGQNSFTGKNGAALTVEPGAVLSLVPEEDSESAFTGASGYAGIEVAFTDASMGSLVIDGSGKINAYGGSGSAGIGGSYNTGDVNGNITIENGTIKATAGLNGAGIGSAYSNGSSGSSRSYKPNAANWGKITINGGDITAAGAAGCGAGIGGGSHVDGGDIEINGGVISATGSSGIGSGLGSNENKDNTKGPGYVNGGHIVITNGTISAESNGNGAGIGGGEYADSGIIEISGGDITAKGSKGSDNYHHGGAGIGGGYEGEANVTISGGTIKAYGAAAAAGIGSGGTPNFKKDRKTSGKMEPKYARKADTATETVINIKGGDITAYGGSKGGAGIGEGAGGEKVEINISGGSIKAYGASSDRDSKQGGAGIGSGFYNSTDSYHVEADTAIDISGCDSILSVGGWGACGIGSGAGNKNSTGISISGTAKLLAQADGTKFAIDSAPKSDTSVNVNDKIIEGTFVDWEDENNLYRRYETLGVQIRAYKSTATEAGTFRMPEGYRSFAYNGLKIEKAKQYLVYSDTEKSKGYYVYNTEAPHEFYEKDEGDANTYLYSADGTSFSDNYWLYLASTDPVLPAEKTYSLTVKYLDQDTGEAIADPYTKSDNAAGAAYDMTSTAGKAITGYTFTRNDGELSGKFSGDVTIISYYTKNAAVTPASPSNPATPETPVTPVTPITPTNPSTPGTSGESGGSDSGNVTPTVRITSEPIPQNNGSVPSESETEEEPAGTEITDEGIPSGVLTDLPKTGESRKDLLFPAGVMLLILFSASFAVSRKKTDLQ